MSIASALHLSRAGLLLQDGRRQLATVMLPGAAGIAEVQDGVGIVAVGPQHSAAIPVPRRVCPLRIGGVCRPAVQTSRTGL